MQWLFVDYSTGLLRNFEQKKGTPLGCRRLWMSELLVASVFAIWALFVGSEHVADYSGASACGTLASAAEGTSKQASAVFGCHDTGAFITVAIMQFSYSGATFACTIYTISHNTGLL